MRKEQHLRVRLSYKILAVFFILSVFSAVLSTLMLRYFAVSHFKQYVREMDLNAVQKIIPPLVDYFQNHDEWDGLHRNHARWSALLDKSLGPEFSNGPEHRPDGGPTELPENDHMEVPEPDWGPPGPPGNGHLKMRIGLFDSKKQKVAGPPGTLEEFDLQEIKISGRTAGWVGLKELPRPPRPIEIEFIRRQFRVFYMVGGVLLLLSALGALQLSRSLLSPVRRLAVGTLALSKRRFDTRIAVESSDELGQLAHNFNAMAEQLEQYENRQKNWLTDISHELRTPLSILIGEIEAIQDGVRMPDEKSLASLHAEASHLQKIVNDLHDLSLAEADAMPLRKRRTDPFFILHELVESFSERSRECGLKAVVEFFGDSTPYINGDPDRLRQVFVNLYHNVVQHSKMPGTLTIHGRVVGHLLQISFEDSGPGVPDDALAYLFDRLYREETSRSRTKGGSGLGLSICKSIIENHGGEIRAAKGDFGGLRIEIDLEINGI